MPRSEDSSDNSAPVYKIMSRSEWTDAADQGVFRGAAIDLTDGFIHLSAAGQVAKTAALHFEGQEDLVLAAVDPGALGDALVWEPSRGGDLFPHLYGHLPVAAVISADPMPLGPDGVHRLPGLPSAPEAGDKTGDRN